MYHPEGQTAVAKFVARATESNNSLALGQEPYPKAWNKAIRSRKGAVVAVLLSGCEGL